MDDQPAVDHDEWGDTYVLTELDGDDRGNDNDEDDEDDDDQDDDTDDDDQDDDSAQHTVVIPFGEDTGTHTVAYRVARGEPSLFDPDAWQTVQVATNCQPDPAPTATVSDVADAPRRRPATSCT